MSLVVWSIPAPGIDHTTSDMRARAVRLEVQPGRPGRRVPPVRQRDLKNRNRLVGIGPTTVGFFALISCWM